MLAVAMIIYAERKISSNGGCECGVGAVGPAAELRRQPEEVLPRGPIIPTSANKLF